MDNTLYIWTKDSSEKVREALAPLLNASGAMVHVVSSLKGLPTDKIVLALGGDTKDLMQANGLIPKGRTTVSLRHKVWNIGGVGKFMFSFSPGVRFLDSGRFTDLQCDLRVALRFAETGEYEPKMGEYRWVEDFGDAINGIMKQYKLTGKPIDAAFDTETTGTNCYSPNTHFVALQLTWQPGKTDMVYFANKAEWETWFSKWHHQLEFLMTTPMLSLGMANGKYDCTWVAVKTGIECTNFKFDTLLVGSLLDENRSNSLTVHAKIYTALGGYDDAFNAKYDKGHMELVPKPDMLHYGGGDTHACYDTRLVMREELKKDPPLARFYVNILHPAARAFEDIEQTGVTVDMKEYAKVEADVKATILQSIANVRKVVPGRIFIKHEDSSKFGGINLTKSSFLIDFLFSPQGLNLKPKMYTPKPLKDGTRVPSTSAEHLKMFADHPDAKEFMDAMAGYGSAKKILDTYITGFLKSLKDDGKFHPGYFLFAGDRDDDDQGGTNTGRLSAKDPAIQTVPKHGEWGKRLRRCLVAPPGYVCLESDYSQGELRVVACVANEPTMLQVYRDGKDMHTMTAAKVNGYTYEQMLQLQEENPELFDILRGRAKPGNFGLLYGMGAEGFMNYARINYGVHITLQEAENFRNAFFEAYSGLIAYHHEYKARAKRDLQIRSPLGRLRHLPLIRSPDRMIASQAERQAINSPIQGTLSDMLIWSCANWHKQGYQKVAPIFATIHDASYAYAPEDRVDEFALKMRDTMQNLEFAKVGWSPQLKFIADVKAGVNLTDLSKVKFNA